MIMIIVNHDLVRITFQSVIAEAPQKLDKQSSFIFLGFSIAFVYKEKVPHST